MKARRSDARSRRLFSNADKGIRRSGVIRNRYGSYIGSIVGVLGVAGGAERPV